MMNTRKIDDKFKTGFLIVDENNFKFHVLCRKIDVVVFFYYPSGRWDFWSTEAKKNIACEAFWKNLKEEFGKDETIQFCLFDLSVTQKRGVSVGCYIYPANQPEEMSVRFECNSATGYQEMGDFLKRNRTKIVVDDFFVKNQSPENTQNRFFQLQQMPRIAADWQYSVYLSPNGVVYTFGKNGPYGQLGHGNENTKVSLPTPINYFVKNNVKIDKVKCSDEIVFFRSFPHGRWFCCGRISVFGGKIGQLKRLKHSSIPVLHPFLASKKVLKVKLGGNFCFFLIEEEGKRVLYGAGVRRFLGIGSDDERVQTIPVRIRFFDDKGIKMIRCGRRHSFVMDSNGRLFATGKNDYDQFGPIDLRRSMNESDCFNTFNEIVFFRDQSIRIRNIRCSWGSSYFLAEDNAIYSCGHNNHGELGLGQSNIKEEISVPQRINFKGDENVSKIFVGGYNAFLVSKDGKTIWGCGRNEKGKGDIGVIGGGNKIGVPTRIPIPQLKEHEKIIRVDCDPRGYNESGHAFFTSSFGRIFGVGSNKFGQVGCRSTGNVEVVEILEDISGPELLRESRVQHFVETNDENGFGFFLAETKKTDLSAENNRLLSILLKKNTSIQLVFKLVEIESVQKKISAVDITKILCMSIDSKDFEIVQELYELEEIREKMKAYPELLKVVEEKFVRELESSQSSKVEELYFLFKLHFGFGNITNGKNEELEKVKEMFENNKVRNENKALSEEVMKMKTEIRKQTTKLSKCKSDLDVARSINKAKEQKIAELSILKDKDVEIAMENQKKKYIEIMCKLLTEKSENYQEKIEVVDQIEIEKTVIIVSKFIHILKTGDGNAYFAIQMMKGLHGCRNFNKKDEMINIEEYQWTKNIFEIFGEVISSNEFKFIDESCSCSNVMKLKICMLFKNILLLLKSRLYTKYVHTCVDLENNCQDDLKLTESLSGISSEIQKMVGSNGKEIGRGGQGVVWKISYKNEILAVKEVNRSSGGRVEEEMEAMKKLGVHPNIVKPLVTFENNQNWFIVMPYFSLNGRDFLHILPFFPKRTRKLLILKFLISVAEGLIYIHSKKIVHRDIKPENCLIKWTEKGMERVVICDFGFVRTTFGSEKTLDVGTLGYMAPEVRSNINRDGHYMEKVDYFSFGKLIYDFIPFVEDEKEIVRIAERLVKENPLKRPENLRDIISTFERRFHEVKEFHKLTKYEIVVMSVFIDGGEIEMCKSFSFDQEIDLMIQVLSSLKKSVLDFNFVCESIPDNKRIEDFGNFNICNIRLEKGNKKNSFLVFKDCRVKRTIDCEDFQSIGEKSEFLKSKIEYIDRNRKEEGEIGSLLYAIMTGKQDFVKWATGNSEKK